MNRVFVFGAMLLAMLAPSLARAGTPYSIHWINIQENPTCETAALGAHDGEAFFHVNEAPIPTYEIPGAFTKNADGTESNVAEAAFDSVLLRIGANDFLFTIRNDRDNDACAHQQNLASLVSVPLGINKPLFDVRRDGTAFAGKTQLALSLQEINPPLARDIANLEAEIEAERKWLIANAEKTAALAARLDLLQQLDTELRDLVTRPLDEIAQTDLDAILNRYASVIDEATKAALEQLLADLKKSVQDLEEELARLIDEFGAQADDVVDRVTADARGAGFLPDDPSGYALGAGDVPWVDVPDVSSVAGAFDPGKDPYAAYADAVIAGLAQHVQGGKVVHRGDFAASVRAWRSNQAALQEALLMRTSVSQAETSAFLNAQNKVTNYVRQFMDASDWFLDSPVPPDLRAQVDGVLKVAFGVLAQELKEALNRWGGPTLDSERMILVDTIRGFAGGMSVLGDAATAYADVMQTLVYATARVGIGFVPYVGPALDLCEAVTGKEWCLPSGKDLSTGERIFSGVGFGIGSVTKVWAGVKTAGISPGGKAAAAGIVSFGDEFAKALQASRRTNYKALRGVAVPITDAFEAKAGLHLMKNEGRAMIGVGDEGVRTVLKIPEPTSSTVPGASLAPDFLTVTKGNKLALSEVKAGGNAPTSHAINQLANAMEKLKELNLAGDVERVEIIIKKGHDLGEDYAILNGYVVRPSEGNKRVTLKGFTNLIMVIEL